MFSESVRTNPTVKVKNEVLWINPKLDLPFKLKEGEPSSLGVFVVSSDTHTDCNIRVGIDGFHGRSVYLGRFKIPPSSEGIIYRDVDLKGAGYIELNFRDKDPKVLPISIRDNESTHGLWRIEKGQREIGITEDLTKEKARTNRIAALIALYEIALPDGNKLTINQAKDQGLIHQDETPVIGVRVSRLRDRMSHPYMRRFEVITDAKKIVEEELGYLLSWQEYLMWFSSTMGTNLATVHKADYWHGSPDSHNISPVAEILDFGLGEYSVMKKRSQLTTEEESYYLWRDYQEVVSCVGQMCGMVQYDLAKRSELRVGSNFRHVFQDAYLKVLPNTRIEELVERRHETTIPVRIRHIAQSSINTLVENIRALV
jgi:hypothetical protein